MQLKIRRSNSRIIKDIHWNLLASRIQCLLDFETPEQPCDRDESPLFSESNTRAHPPAPSKCHVPLLTREGAVIGVVFEEPVRIEAVWVWEFAFVVVDGPCVTLDPGRLGDKITLFALLV